MGLVAALRVTLGVVVFRLGERGRCRGCRDGGVAAAGCTRVVAVTFPATLMSPPVLVSLFPHAVFVVVEELLLRPDYRPRAANAAQRDRLRRGVPVVLHHVQGYVGPCSTETGLAVNGNRPLFSSAQEARVRVQPTPT